MLMDVIHVENLVKKFGNITAVDGIQLDVQSGQIFGFLGPNGAGKSTTIKILATLLKPTSGRAAVAGFDVVARPNEVRQSIGLVFQDQSLDDRLTAQENLWFHAMLYDLPSTLFAERIEDVLRLVDLIDRRHSLVRTFSGGMKRRLEIARGVLHHPKVLFLDEPTLGLDPQTRKHIWDYLQELRRREGVTLFMTTHYMYEAEFCDRIAIIDRGKIVALGTPAELKSRIGGDVITLTVADVPAAAKEIAERFGIAPLAANGTLRIEVPDGASFLPRLVRDLPMGIDSVALSRPSLDDVFLKLTGHAIRTEGASEKDMLRNMGRMWRGGRR